MEGTTDAPVGLCIACAHVITLAVYRESRFGVRLVGLCGVCRDLAEFNRGPCTPERGCRCAPKEEES